MLVHRVELGSTRCPGKVHAWLAGESAATLGARTGEFRGVRLQVTGQSIDNQQITLMFLNA